MGHLFYLLHSWHFAISENPSRILLCIFVCVFLNYICVLQKVCFLHCCVILFGDVMWRQNPICWEKIICFASLDFISGVPLQATALSNLHFLNQIFPYWILTRSISCRDQPCGFSCIHGEQCLCAWVPGVSLSPKRGGTVQPRAWSRLPGTVCPAGWGGRLWPLESRKASEALLCPMERHRGSKDSRRTLHWHLPALPAWGHSTPAERGQHYFIKPCAKSETSDTIFPPLHSFLWCFTSHYLIACPYPAWNTNLMNVQSDCYDAKKSCTSPGVKHHPRLSLGVRSAFENCIWWHLALCFVSLNVPLFLMQFPVALHSFLLHWPTGKC